MERDMGGTVEDLPYWVRLAGAVGPLAVSLATLLVSAAVGTIAYRQWKTARDRLVLDLFDRRFAVFMLAQEALSRVMRDGTAKDGEALAQITEAWHQSRFLFGDEMTAFLDLVRGKMLDLQFANERLDRGSSDRNDWAEKGSVLFRSLVDDLKGLADRFAPYMRMRQRIDK